jgi:hypothetical protein
MSASEATVFPPALSRLLVNNPRNGKIIAGIVNGRGIFGPSPYVIATVAEIIDGVGGLRFLGDLPSRPTTVIVQWSTDTGPNIVAEISDYVVFVDGWSCGGPSEAVSQINDLIAERSSPKAPASHLTPIIEFAQLGMHQELYKAALTTEAGLESAVAAVADKLGKPAATAFTLYVAHRAQAIEPKE